MKRNILPLALIAFAAFVVSVVPKAEARTCSNATVAGEYGFSSSGSLKLPTGTVPIVQVGRITEDKDGNVAGSQILSVGFNVRDEVFKGTFSIKPDCTATVIVDVFDAASGAPLGRATLNMVIVDNGRKQLGMSTALVRDGMTVPAAITIVGERIFPGEEEGSSPRD